MKMLKSLLRVALAVALVAAPVVVNAESGKQSPAQAGQFGGIHENLEFYGTIPCRISDSTTAVLCKSGEGLLDAICADGGTAIGYSLGVDSGVAGSRSVTNSDSLLISPTVFAKPDTASMVGGIYCWSAKREIGGPVRFVNGLVGVQSAATHSTILYWHYSDGSNP